MFKTLSNEQLDRAHGGVKCDLSGVPAAGRSIIMAESGGESTAKNPTSTAFGLGQLTIANRRALMSNPSSTSCSDQLDAFHRYTMGRYSSYDRALSFRKKHGWY